jgi:energy-coupling factor transporter ATP-binding protein EcfA2
MSAAAPTSGPLRPVELATAAVMGGVTVVLAVLGVVVPVAGILQVLAVVPLGVVAQRHRPRALVAATVAAGVVGFLVAGTAPLTVIGLAALIGGIVGEVKRRGRGAGTAALAFTVAAPAVALLVVGLLLVFSSLRDLTLQTIRNSVRGVTGIIGTIPGTRGATSRVDAATDTLVDNWWWTVGGAVVLSVVVTGVIAWGALGAVLERLDRLPVTDRLDGADGDDRTPAPVPVALVGAGFRYPGARLDALTGVDLVLDRPQMVAVLGDNGSGKSTLVRLLAGRAPTSGTVHRGGPAGLGRLGGTALIAQRPESQVLGARVRDDVVWGLPASATVDVEGLLAAVGLAGTGDRATTGLSGGQLQRLAIAAALARSPRLLLSDESTAMVDPAGRAEMVALLASLPRRTGTTVVHVSHRPADAVAADRVVAVRAGRVHELGGAPAAAEPPLPHRTGRHPGPALLVLRGVGHVYDARTPWAHRALTGVDLEVARGEAVVLVGGNGSGKSTLAWVLGGLLRPTEGTATLDGRSITSQVGSVAVAFQHARLQVQRPTVGEDVAAAAGHGSAAHPSVARALATVGLDPAVAARGTDTLSGGQLRRAALAGLLVTNPRVLVLDEPLAGLDAPSRAGLVDVLARLREEQGLTLVVVSHDVAEIAAICDRTVLVEHGRTHAEPTGVPR